MANAVSRALVLFAVAIAAKAALAAAGFDLRVDQETITFWGPLNKESAAALHAGFAAGARRLVVTSWGGDANAGFEIAADLQKYSVDVEVKAYCLSACANYIFLFGNSKTLPPGALLGFHGGMVRGRRSLEASAAASGQVDPVISELSRNFERMFATEENLFQGIGVDHALLALSARRTKGDGSQKKRFHFVFLDGTTKTMEENDSEAAMRLMDELTKSRQFDSIRVDYLSSLANLFYFPSEATLRKHGVTGLRAYAYPKSQQELTDTTHRVYPGLTLSGDF